jgi:hypothetical protein
MFSATLHSPEIKELAEKITKFPTWVDLKGPYDRIPSARNMPTAACDASAPLHDVIYPCSTNAMRFHLRTIGFTWALWGEVGWDWVGQQLRPGAGAGQQPDRESRSSAGATGWHRIGSLPLSRIGE